MEKKCNTCKQTKELSEFYKRGSKKNSLSSQCKVCIRQCTARCQVAYSKGLKPHKERSSKKCSICQQIKDASDFYVHGSHADGLSSQCKVCGRQRSANSGAAYSDGIRPYKEIESKKCCTCNQIKERSAFYKQRSKSDGLQNQCKVCVKKHNTEYKASHKDEIKVYNKTYTQTHKPEIRKQEQFYQKTHKEQIRAREKKYRKENRKELNAKQTRRQKERKSRDPVYKLSVNLRGRTREAIKKAGFTKTQHFKDYIGCTPLFCKEYLESKFLPGMTWENYGWGEDKWNIDHITPLSSAKTVEELYKLCHYTNLQPLWQPDNFRKGKKILKNK